jgi:hypothetical protein
MVIGGPFHLIKDQPEGFRGNNPKPVAMIVSELHG